MEASVSFEADAALRLSMSAKELASVSPTADAALRLSVSVKERSVVSLEADAALRLSVSAKVEVSLAGGQDVEPEVEDRLVEETCRG